MLQDLNQCKICRDK